VLNLLVELQDRLGLSYVFISHDLSVVQYLCDTVSVMYLGRVVESAAAAEIFRAPRHPYTQALLAAVPSPDPSHVAIEQAPLEGDVPSSSRPPAGCAFHTRCPRVVARCRVERPLLRDTDGSDHLAACHLL
jgi:oligopeptide/dipeptide ABC transporter ATP-binding protein